MPTNNTPFTWNDAQWLNTQITNCVERSIQAIVTAEQALAMVGSFCTGPRLLSKVTGVNLNPVITLTYTSLVNTFTVGSTITDANGSTAIILTDNGTNSMTITSTAFAPGYTNFSGAITESPGTGSAVVNTVNWGDQAITLAGGNTFIITDIVLTNASAVPTHAYDAEWWGGIGRTGINYANTVTNMEVVGGGGLGGLGGGGTIPLPFPLANANEYMSISNIEIAYPAQANGNSPSVSGPALYLTIGSPEGSPLTCDMYIFGYVLN